MVEGCAQGIKLTLFNINFVFLIFGISMISYCAYLTSSGQTYNSLTFGASLTVPNLFISVGAFVSFLSFLGCCGTAQESVGMLFAYVIMLIIVFIISLISGIHALTSTKSVKESIKTNMLRTMNNYNNDHTMWDKLQKDESKFDKDIEKRIKCAVTSTSDSVERYYSHCDFKERGCLDALLEYLNSSTNTVTYISFFVAFIEILLILFAVLLASKIVRQQYAIPEVMVKHH